MAQGISRRGFLGLLAGLAGLGLARRARAGSGSAGATSGAGRPPTPGYDYGWVHSPCKGLQRTWTCTYDASGRLRTITAPLKSGATSVCEYTPPSGRGRVGSAPALERPSDRASTCPPAESKRL
jgi:hypothetical protein